MSDITAIEINELSTCESVIERGLKTFYEVGDALQTIRDRRLYRVTHDTFEGYCKERWQMERRQAYRLMDAADVVRDVSNWTQNNDVILPRTESQARPLTQVQPEHRAEVWTRAVESAPDGKITAAHVEHVVEEYKAAPSPHVTHNSGDNEWYTPAEYIRAAVKVMGDIDLDPASSQEANIIVNTGLYFDAEMDGLALPWHGRVWLNPPYAGELIGKFCAKLSDSFQAGQVTEAIVLVNNATETKWFQGLCANAKAICFPSSRIRFWHPLKVSAPLQGQAVIYLGKNAESFSAEFRQFGMVCNVL